ncbi:MAG: alpha/beta hydrolase [Desulfosarcinaceae bacterium]
MAEKQANAYAQLDHPGILEVIFHPRKAIHPPSANPGVSDHDIPVADDCHIGARFHAGVGDGVNVLFFHGNGEIVPDYDDLGPVYNQMGINLLAVDYRGYGQSTGLPTVSAMMEDCHSIYHYVREWLANNGRPGPLVAMGRSLGSASALELASSYGEDIDGLVIESGFAYTLPLLRLLGARPPADAAGELDLGNLDKIGAYTGPTLVIHAQYDHIIPFSDGQALYAARGAFRKRLLRIRDADHNDILLQGFKEYMQALKGFTAWLATE